MRLSLLDYENKNGIKDYDLNPDTIPGVLGHIFTGGVYGTRHFKMACSEPGISQPLTRTGHILIGIIECIPVVGTFAAIIDHYAAKYFEDKTKNDPPSAEYFEDKTKNASSQDTQVSSIDYDLANQPLWSKQLPELDLALFPHNPNLKKVPDNLGKLLEQGAGWKRGSRFWIGKAKNNLFSTIYKTEGIEYIITNGKDSIGILHEKGTNNETLCIKLYPVPNCFISMGFKMTVPPQISSKIKELIN